MTTKINIEQTKVAKAITRIIGLANNAEQLTAKVKGAIAYDLLIDNPTIDTKTLWDLVPAGTQTAIIDNRTDWSYLFSIKVDTRTKDGTLSISAGSTLKNTKSVMPDVLQFANTHNKSVAANVQIANTLTDVKVRDNALKGLHAYSPDYNGFATARRDYKASQPQADMTEEAMSKWIANRTDNDKVLLQALLS